MASKAPPPQVQQPITKPMTKEEQQKQQELKTKYILDIARKRVGLKPVTPDHISQQAKKPQLPQNGSTRLPRERIKDN